MLTQDFSSNIRIECRSSEAFAEWLAGLNGSLAVTTYQAGRIALLGWRGTQTSLLMREFEKPMGLAVGSGKLALATKHEVTLLHDAPLLAPDLLPDQPAHYDALYLPRATYHTGDINIHDMAFGTDGLWMVNFRFSCLSAFAKVFHSFSLAATESILARVGESAVLFLKYPWA